MKKGSGHALASFGTQAFVEEYERHSPLRSSGLLYYWSAALLTVMLHGVLNRHLDEDTWKARLAFFESEYHDLPRLVAGLR